MTAHKRFICLTCLESPERYVDFEEWQHTCGGLVIETQEASMTSALRNTLRRLRAERDRLWAELADARISRDRFEEELLDERHHHTAAKQMRDEYHAERDAAIADLATARERIGRLVEALKRIESAPCGHCGRGEPEAGDIARAALADESEGT